MMPKNGAFLAAIRVRLSVHRRGEIAHDFSKIPGKSWTIHASPKWPLFLPNDGEGLSKFRAAIWGDGAPEMRPKWAFLEAIRVQNGPPIDDVALSMIIPNFADIVGNPCVSKMAPFVT